MKNISFIYKAFILLFLLVSFSSCEEIIDLPLKGADSPALIVEAEIVDKEGSSFVRLGETLDYYEPIEEPKASGAIISVTDQNGVKMDFLESDEAGLYLPQDSDYKGVIGNTYTLAIEYKGNSFTSESTIFPVTGIDSLQIRFVPESRFQDEGYYLYFYGKEPQDTKDYYFWRNYKNDTLNYEDVGDLVFATDQGIGENIDGLQFPFVYDAGDTVRLEMYSISEEAYNFYDDLTAVVFNDGGLFSPPPVNPRTNIEGTTTNVLGVFMTSSVVSATIYVPEE
ncbi:hypothetical protein Fleli_3736 [Bernardetia litoralis DSM 6794]|uniref:DUF4249 domain-containing protein n=1 Tax=Bernardetia litoralis (strain ATCC 23117 / DSM 6794 / NBRC 15988 / NCIMB 1366 / Fx l1 / Sio-4) TaxID=880071 RepID=I4AQ13_BERLS|nr:DUF4249 domain-containing protein [Bernardetia litoralis]AFM06048.1 hypothetical protein Fleli_3736 [Bernardetia litoralis DSM 6794]